MYYASAAVSRKLIGTRTRPALVTAYSATSSLALLAAITATRPPGADAYRELGRRCDGLLLALDRLRSGGRAPGTPGTPDSSTTPRRAAWTSRARRRKSAVVTGVCMVMTGGRAWTFHQHLGVDRQRFG